MLGCLLALSSRVAHTQSGAPQPRNDEALLAACEQSLACSSHLSRATKLYEQDSYSAALDEYQAAYILQPYPLILYNIARIHHKQLSLADAISYYERYLDTGHEQLAERARELLFKARQELNERESQPKPPPQALGGEPKPAPPHAAPPVVRAVPVAPIALPPRVKPPIYKRWWFWTVMGVVAAGTAIALGIGVAAHNPDVSNLPMKTFSFGN